MRKERENMNIEISIRDTSIGKTLVESPMEGVHIEFEYPIIEFAEDKIPELIIFLSLIKDVSIGLFTAWLYDKLKNSNANKITINGNVAKIDKIEIEKLIIKESKKKKKWKFKKKKPIKFVKPS